MNSLIKGYLNLKGLWLSWLTLMIVCSCGTDSKQNFKDELPFEIEANDETLPLEEYIHSSKAWSILLPTGWEIRENENSSATNSMIAIDSSIYLSEEPDTLLIIPISVSQMEKTSYSLKKAHEMALEGFKNDFPNLKTIDMGYGKMKFGKVTWHFYSLEDELGIYHGLQLMYKSQDSSIYILEIGFQGRFSMDLLKEYFYILNTVDFKD